ncbi:unnamed protein product [Rotaria magnacalcarata]|uniref:Uncharacterized protein n=1 Tax=Rotaria magnacalcarata TaxID=392030 RepID=A0A816T4H8_9BILA|nr:unnamed protein product [Rotaria magnacalcarata]CAF4161972.1 unnamed protein product [Rotaria magnacalcarata]
MAAENVGKKLVCQQTDNSLDAPRGYCNLLNDDCSCTDDCVGTLSKSDCICTTSDLLYAQQSWLANCSAWTQDEWAKYIRVARPKSGFVSVAPSNFKGGKKLVFSAYERGIAWPTTRALGSEVLFIHGPHCLHMVKKFNDIVKSGKTLDNNYDRSHADHCRRLARRVLAYYTTTEKEYRVQPESLCHDIRVEYNGDNLLPKSGDSDQSRRLGYGIRYGISYGKRSLNSNKTQYRPQAIYKALYARAQKEENTTQPSQQTIFDLISGHNLGNLLVKEWLQLPMTSREKILIQEWESDYVVRMAAFGIYCITGKGEKAPIDKIQNLLLMKQ